MTCGCDDFGAPVPYVPGYRLISPGLNIGNGRTKNGMFQGDSGDPYEPVVQDDVYDVPVVVVAPGPVEPGPTDERPQNSVESIRAQVQELTERAVQAEQRLAAQVDTQVPWWQQKVGPVPSGWIVAGIGAMALWALLRK